MIEARGFLLDLTLARLIALRYRHSQLTVALSQKERTGISSPDPKSSSISTARCSKQQEATTIFTCAFFSWIGLDRTSAAKHDNMRGGEIAGLSVVLPRAEGLVLGPCRRLVPGMQGWGAGISWVWGSHYASLV